MQNVILLVHLLLTLALIGVVLLQRSEGGGLGMGGGGGGVVSSRGAATALGKLTWAFAAAFIATSLTLTIFAAKNSADTSVLDRLGIEQPAPGEADPLLPPAEELLPPTTGDGPALPPTLDQ